MRCEIEVSGNVAVEPLLRSVFQAMSGRQLPTEATGNEDIAYDRETSQYRTADGDGLDVSEILDYGEWHHTWWYSLVVRDELTIEVHQRREPTLVFYVNAKEAAPIETFVQLATTAGFTLIRRS